MVPLPPGSPSSLHSLNQELDNLNCQEVLDILSTPIPIQPQILQESPTVTARLSPQWTTPPILTQLPPPGTTAFGCVI